MEDYHEIIRCSRCGRCCETYPIDVVWSDLKRWEKEGRNDILMEVSFVNNYPEEGYAGVYIEKTLRAPKQPCPFFKGDACSIYDTRPLVCRDFPMSHDKSVCPNQNLNSKKLNGWARKKMGDRRARQMQKALDHFNDTMAILVKARRSGEVNLG